MDLLGLLRRFLAHVRWGAGQLVSNHPRGLASLVVLGLAGFAATAFGIAPMAPDAADLPRSVVTEAVESNDIVAQLDALAEHELSLFRSDVTRSGDTADALLQRLNITDPAAAAFLRSDPVARQVLEGRSGKMVRARANATGEMLELVARFAAPAGIQARTHFTRLSVVRADGRFRTRLEIAPLVARQRLGSGTIQSSLFAATDEARIPDAIAIQLADIFGSDVDFRRELRKGDTFSMVYETMTADGEAVAWTASAGRVIAAEFVNKGRAFSAIWFKDEQGKGAYYDFDGKSRTRSYLTSPLEFSRTTSGFAMRMHPILKQWRQHNGVDYAAPRGTSVRSVADGSVKFAGRQSGYGNVVQIRHGKDRETVYAHLSRIDVSVGQRVEQGQYIGAVGATGWATGPHLHFEFKIAGDPTDPETMIQGSEVVVLEASTRSRFDRLAQGFRGPLDVAQTVGQTAAYVE